MPELDPERIEIAEELRRQIASENRLTALQARAFVRGVQISWSVQPILWSGNNSRGQYEDARRLLNAASILNNTESGNSESARLCYKRAAELLEWLARARDKLSTSVPLELLAAAAYQLGGSPAMASALLAPVEREHSGEILYAHFLRADFDSVIQAVSKFWREHFELTDRNAPRRILLEEDDDKFEWFTTVELVRVLGLIADTIRRGDDDRFKVAKRKLVGIEQFSSRTCNDEISLLITLLYQVTEAFSESSIYGPIRLLSQMKSERSSRLEEFARGQFSRGRGILWTSQREGLARLLTEESFALCTPTGSGKTLVANMALVKELLLRAEEDDPLALYLVPSRALASEVESKLSSELSNDVIVTGLYGGTDWGITDYWLGADKPTVLIATVEKADALMRYLAPMLLGRMQLLIVDEAHHVVPENNERTQDNFAEHSSRSLRLEAFVSKLLARAPNLARVALTAVAGGAAPSIARWIEGRDEATPVGSNYRSTRQIIGSFETTPDRAGRMLLEILDERPLFVRGRDEPVYINLRTPPMPRLPAVMRDSINRFNQLDILWTALHLADGDRRILISVAQKPEQTMRWYKEALSHASWSDAPPFEMPLDEEDQRRFEETSVACIDYCGPNSYEVALLDRGIACNHGQMPQRIRRMMIDLIERGICPVTLATSTLTDGVNLPFDIIFVPSLMRMSFDPVNGQQVANSMSTAEFRNLAGRAGRPGSGNGLEGITLVPIPTWPSTTAQKNLQKQQWQIKNMNAYWQTLRQSLLEEELEQSDIDSPLALLLDGIAERARELLNVKNEEFLDWLERVIPLDISVAAGQASRDKMARLADSVDELDGVLLSALEELQRLDEAELKGADAEVALSAIWRRTFSAVAAAQEAWMEQAFIRRGQAILQNIYPEREMRSRLYQYGFTPYVGERFEAVLPELLALLGQAADYGSAKDAARLELFVQLGNLVANDRGFGFNVRSTTTDQDLMENWQNVLSWWMRGPDHRGPDPSDLRAWQRFVSDNLEFRLGVGLGAVVARAWSDGVNGALIVPSLDTWRETTGLPWFGFWARELLRWGTLDPFVAFALAEGLAGTRSEGEALREQFDEWLIDGRDEVTSDDRIDPQLFLKWRRSRNQAAELEILRKSVNAALDGTDGNRSHYSVIPVVSNTTIHWLDAAGYSLARSETAESPFQGLLHKDDFRLSAAREQPLVSRVFSRLD